MPTSETARMHVKVEGLVQGVGFRMFVLEKARRYNLTGWVRNTLLGEVEVVAEGPRSTLMSFFQDLKVGPPSAHVIDFSLDWEPVTGEFKRFEVHMTV